MSLILQRYQIIPFEIEVQYRTKALQLNNVLGELVGH